MVRNMGAARQDFSRCPIAVSMGPTHGGNMTWQREPRRMSRWTTTAFPAVVLIVGLLVSAVAWWLANLWVERETLADQEKQVTLLHGQLQEHLSLYDQALRASGAFVQQTGTEEFSDWIAFTDQLRAKTSLQGTLVLAYARAVSRDQVSQLVRAARDQGLVDFHVWPSDQSDHLVINRLVSPATAENVAALGFEMFHDPVRREAIEAARDSGDTAVSGTVTLSIDGRVNTQDPAFLIYFPVYRRGLPLDTVDHRREAFTGVTLTPVRMSSLLSQVLIQATVPTILDVRDDQGGVTYTTAVSQGPKVKRWFIRHIIFSNRGWVVSYGFPPDKTMSLRLVVPWLVLGFGLIVSALLTMVVRKVVQDRAYAMRLASDMTRALRESEARFRAVFDNSVHYQSLLAADGSLISANPAALSLVGGDVGPLAGLPFWNVGWINRESERARLREALLQSAAGATVRLDVIRDSGGEEMWINVSFKPVLGVDGQVAWIVAEGRDLTEWHRREDALSQAIDALTRSSQELERFAHVAAHDLQEPCRTVVSYAQLLQRRQAGNLDRESLEFLNYLVGGALRMRDLIGDLLAYTQMADTITPFETIDCTRVVAEVLEDMSHEIDEAEAEIVVGNLPEIVGEWALLVQLFHNLLSNALKFRAPGVSPRISISARLEDGQWIISVADNGIGIAPDYHQRIFEVFQRLHGQDRFPGTGIGLAICRRVVERLSGRIWVESAEGHGATFHFTVPHLS